MTKTTKNLGQVAGVHIGTSAPTNTTLIWYDSTSAVMCHKVYDIALRSWVVLYESVISLITYAELTNIAQNTGLTVGQWYKISNIGNLLALSITSTKVQYTDLLGNIVIDDLGTNMQYLVTTDNITIDDIAGVFNTTTKKVDFTFTEVTPDVTDSTNYVFGKRTVGAVVQLVKYKLSSFLSPTTGNTITWSNGYFLNFYEQLKKYFDKSGGVVSKEAYDRDKEVLETSISNVGKENQKIVTDATQAIANATTNSQIFSKALPSITTSGANIDIVAGDTLLSLVSKIQRFINSFKYATGVMMSANFFAATTDSSVNNSDSVNSAIAKLQGALNIIKNSISTMRFSLPSDWSASSTTNSAVEAGDSYDNAFAKIEADRHAKSSLELSMRTVAIGAAGSDISAQGSAYIKINNGVLSVYMYSGFTTTRAYTRMETNDKTWFFPINIPEATLEAIKDYITVNQNIYYDEGAFILSDICSMSLNKVEYVAPSFDIVAKISFGYYYDGIDFSVGLVVSPQSKCGCVGGIFYVTEVTDLTTFQDLSGAESLTYVFPRLAFQYHLL